MTVLDIYIIAFAPVIASDVLDLITYRCERNAQKLGFMNISFVWLEQISHTNRSDECIEYLIGRTQMELEIVFNESICLYKSFFGEVETRASLPRSNLMKADTRSLIQGGTGVLPSRPTTVCYKIKHITNDQRCIRA